MMPTMSPPSRNDFPPPSQGGKLLWAAKKIGSKIGNRPSKNNAMNAPRNDQTDNATRRFEKGSITSQAITGGETIAAKNASSGNATAKAQRRQKAVTARRRRAREKVRGITFWILDLGFWIGERGGERLPRRARRARRTAEGRGITTKYAN